MYSMKKFPLKVVKALDDLKGGRDFELFMEWLLEARTELEYRIAYAIDEEVGHIQGALALLHHVMNTIEMSRETLESSRRKSRR